MLGKSKEKKEKPVVIDCMHFEGIPGFPVDRPLYITVQDDGLDIRYRKGDGHAFLPMDRITTIETMQERFFVEKYKASLPPMAMKNVIRYFMVVTYDKGQIVFYATTGKGPSQMMDLAAKFSNNVGEVSL